MTEEMENDLLTFEPGTIIEIHCQKCTRNTKHQVVFTKGTVHHVKCRSCTDVRVCEFEHTHRNPRFLDWSDLMEKYKETEKQEYKSDRCFEVGALIEHPSFGTGYVVSLYEPSPKMYVLFEDQGRVMVCGKKAG